jgi:hypothetical protein
MDMGLEEDQIGDSLVVRWDRHPHLKVGGCPCFPALAFHCRGEISGKS